MAAACRQAPTSIGSRQPHVPDASRRTGRRSSRSTFDGKTFTPLQGATGRPTEAGMDRLVARRTAYAARARLSRTSGTSTTSRLVRITNLWTTLSQGRFRSDKIYVVQTQPEGHRALHADVHRSRRPRPRSDVRLWHDRVRCRAVGATLDHDRHVARRSRACAATAHGRQVPVVPAADS